MAGQLHSTAQFFEKTWSNRFNLNEAPAEAQTVLGKIIEGTKEGRRKKVEQTIRAKLLDQMAELTAQRGASTDKAFNANIAPVMRGLGKLIAQKDQTKFFKQLKDFDDSLFALHSKDAATAKKIREDLGLDDEENALEEIADLEKDSIHDYQLTKDLKGTLINLLGPLGPFVHTVRSIKHQYGGGFGKLWGKLKAIVEAREAARAALDDERDQRETRFGKFMRLVKTGLAKIKIRDFFRRITPSKSTIINLGKSLLSKKALGAALGAASLMRVYSRHHNKPEAVATNQSTADTPATATQLPLPTDVQDSADKAHAQLESGQVRQTPAPAPQTKSMIDDAKDAIVGVMSDFGDWFKDKWKGVMDWFGDNPIVMEGLKDIKATKDYLFAKTDKLFKAVPDMLRSVFRSIYEMLPGPIQKGVDWALKVGGESLRFFAKILGNEAIAELDNAPAGAPSTPKQSAPATAVQPGPAAAAPVAAGDAAASSAPGDQKFPGLKITQNADVADLQPAAKSPLLAMAQEYLSQTGKTLQINTAKRSSAEQIALYTDGKHKAAKPGTSMHEYGYAIDMHAADANKLDSMGLLQKYGFVRPVRGEPWHLEPASIQAMKQTIRKNAPGASQAYAAKAVQSTSAMAANNVGGTVGGTPDISKIQAKHEPAKAPTMPGQQGTATAQQVGMDATTAGPGKVVDSAAPAAASVKMQDAKYERAPSFNRRVTKTVSADEYAPPEKQLTVAHKTSMDGISFYIGDFPFLALNMGMTEA